MSHKKEYYRINKVPDYLKELNNEIEVGDVVIKSKIIDGHGDGYGTSLVAEINNRYTCYLIRANLTPITKEEALKYLFKE